MATQLDETYELRTLLEEIRVLLPGPQLLGAFLVSLPFQARFEKISENQRIVFLFTMGSTMLSLVLFLAPAVYHRMTSPLHDRGRFVVLGTRFVLAGFLPLAMSIVLSAYLVASMVTGDLWACLITVVVSVIVAATWAVAPALRLHHRVRQLQPKG